MGQSRQQAIVSTMSILIMYCRQDILTIVILKIYILFWKKAWCCIFWKSHIKNFLFKVHNYVILDSNCLFQYAPSFVCLRLAYNSWQQVFPFSYVPKLSCWWYICNSRQQVLGFSNGPNFSHLIYKRNS